MQCNVHLGGFLLVEHDEADDTRRSSASAHGLCELLCHQMNLGNALLVQVDEYVAYGMLMGFQ